MRRIKWPLEIRQEAVIIVLVVGILVVGFIRAQFDGTGKANFNDCLPRNLRVDRIEVEGGQSAESGNESVVETHLTDDGKNRALTYFNYTIEGPLYRDVTRGQQAQYSMAQKYNSDQDREEAQAYAVAKIIAPMANPSLKAPFEFGVTLLVNGGSKEQSDWFVLSDDGTATYGSASIDYAAARNKGQNMSKYEQHGTWALEENGDAKTYILDFDSVSFRVTMDRA